MTRVAITASVLVADDAVGNDALGMHACLRAAGHEAALFAEAGDSAALPIRPLAELPGYLRGRDAVLVYHHCVGWARGMRLLRRAAGRRILRYHNVTPASFFHGVSATHARVCAAGRRELKALGRGIDLYLCDSEYNRRDLLEYGIPAAKARVVPPFHHGEQLRQAMPDSRTLAGCRDGRTNLLFVGRMAPNKGHLTLVEAFAIFRQHYRPEARLLIVGQEDWRLQGYTAQVRERVERLGVAGAVVFTGDVPVSVLAAYYRSAHVFMSASAHEGFCVPLVEAMALGLPIVAYGATAVPETVGAAGLLWPEPDPYALAAAAGRVVGDSGLARALVGRGEERYREQFSTARVATAFLEAVGAAADQGGRRAA